MTEPDIFQGRTLVIATKHGKEKVIAPLFEKALSCRCIVPADLDTDQFGTFTGEIERLDDPLSAARKKCELAMSLSGAALALASEGSFFPHPLYGFIPGNEELILLVDRKNEIEISARELFTETNFSGVTIRNSAELEKFLSRVNFPGHAVIVRSEEKSLRHLHKGLTEKEQVHQLSEKLIREQGYFWIESDMRAMHNPTRMNAIKKTTEKLIKKIKSLCPTCSSPGFDVRSALPGLPCGYCGWPTRSILEVVYTCERCKYEMHKKFPNGKQYEDPVYCDHCNP